MVGKCLEWCSFHGTPKRCQIGATPKLSLQKTEAWKLKNRCGAGACGGGRTRARTWDPMIKSHLLYQLSYAPGTGPESLRKRASFSKATPRCPASRRGIPPPRQHNTKAKKPPETGCFSRVFIYLRFAWLEPLRTAPAIPIAVHAALEAMVPPASAAGPASHMRQDGQATFLAVVQRLVERVSRVSDSLHRRSRGCHGFGAF